MQTLLLFKRLIRHYTVSWLPGGMCSFTHIPSLMRGMFLIQELKILSYSQFLSNYLKLLLNPCRVSEYRWAVYLMRLLNINAAWGYSLLLEYMHAWYTGCEALSSMLWDFHSVEAKQVNIIFFLPLN